MITNQNIKTVFILIVAASFALVLVPVIVGALVVFVATHVVAIGTAAGTFAVCAALLPAQPVVSFEMVG